MNKKACSRCGVARDLMIQAKVSAFKDQITVGLKWLCGLCFLDFIKIKPDAETKARLAAEAV